MRHDLVKVTITSDTTASYLCTCKFLGRASVSPQFATDLEVHQKATINHAAHAAKAEAKEAERGKPVIWRIEVDDVPAVVAKVGGRVDKLEAALIKSADHCYDNDRALFVRFAKGLVQTFQVELKALAVPGTEDRVKKDEFWDSIRNRYKPALEET